MSNHPKNGAEEGVGEYPREATVPEVTSKFSEFEGALLGAGQPFSEAEVQQMWEEIEAYRAEHGSPFTWQELRDRGLVRGGNGLF